MGAALNEARTIRVLGIRVEFPFEEPDDPLTTGRGRFDMRDTVAFRQEHGHNLDTSPHDRAYFAAHLRALGIYWNVVSNGMLTLDNTVLPVAADSAYQMPEPMGYYGTQVVDDSVVIVDRLRQFVVDAATAASVDPSVMLSDYDAVIFFHAGADGQSDIAGDSPHDLFSAFLTLGETLMLKGGADSLSEATIMPETEIQDNRITVLNGVMAHEFGHQLGLVDLYNTNFAGPFAFATQIGNFSLMDNNGADLGVEATIDERTRIIFGAVPVYPDAWSRAYLGFAAAETVTDTANARVWLAQGIEEVPGNRHMWRVPISQTEYYLIENRQNDVVGSVPLNNQGDIRIISYTSGAGLRLDSNTNVVLGPADTTTFPGQPPVLTSEFDFLLPGSGILIWHVDEGVAALDYVPDDDIDNNFLANTLQWDPQRLFVRLIEASGLWRLGSSGIFSFYTGGEIDYWRQGTQTEFSKSSVPRVGSHTGAVPDIRIHGIGISSPSMQFSVSSATNLSGFPVFAGEAHGDQAAITVTDLTLSAGQWTTPPDGMPEIYAANDDYILGWDWSGQPLSDVAIVDTTFDFDTSITEHSVFPVAIGEDDGSDWLSPPMIMPVEGEAAWMAAITRNGRVHRWEMIDRDTDGLFDLSEVITTSRDPVGAPIIWDNAVVGPSRILFVPLQDGSYDLIGLRSTFHQFNLTGRGTIRGAAGRNQNEARAVYRDGDVWRIGSIGAGGPVVDVTADSLLMPVLGDLDRRDDPASLEVVVADAGGQLFALDRNLDPLAGFPQVLHYHPIAPPILADMDRDGYLDIIVLGDDGMTYAYAHNGALVPNFPMPTGLPYRPEFESVSPLAVDLGVEGFLSTVTGGAERLLYSRDATGAETEGMPRALGNRVTGSAAWAQNTAIDQSGVFVRCADGFLYGFAAPTPGPSPSTATWPMSRRDARAAATVDTDDLGPIDLPAGFFLEERAFVYPNPARDEAIVRYWLGDDARVTISIYDLAGNRVNEWSGSGSGGVYNEWTWECADAASGVYFARLEVTPKNGGAAEQVLCKLSVIQ